MIALRGAGCRLMKVVVGLGNPGREYESTPHSVGFEVVDALAREIGADFRSVPSFKGNLADGRIADARVMLVKPMTFIQINDGTTSLKNLQLTIDQTKIDDEEYKRTVKPALPVGTAIYAEGKVVSSERNVIELLVSELKVLGECPGDYPLQKKKTSMEFLRTIFHHG